MFKFQKKGKTKYFMDRFSIPPSQRLNADNSEIWTAFSDEILVMIDDLIHAHVIFSDLSSPFICQINQS